MDDQNLHNEFFYGDELPINIPSPDEAWDDMRERLEKEKKYGAPWWVTGLFIGGLLLLAIVGIDISTKQHHPHGNSSENMTPKNKIDSDRQNSPTNNHSDAQPENTTDIANNTKKQSPQATMQKDSSSTRASDNILNDKPSFNSHKKIKVGSNKKESIKSSFTKKTKDITAVTKDPLPESQQPDPTETKNTSKDTAKNDLSKKIGAANKPFASDSLKNDSSTEKKQNDEQGVIVEAGLQWTAQLPFENAGSFFTGPNTNTQPYRILLPGAWLTLHTERTLLDFEVNPFYSVLVSNRPFYTSAFSSTISDTVVTTSQTEILNKLFGISAGLGYDYNITGKWWIGANIQADWWSKGVATSKTEINKKSLSGSFNEINTHSSNEYALNDSAWESFSKFQLKLSLEILYRQKMWQAGLRAGLPVTPLAKNDGPIKPFCAEIFFRLRLWTSEKKKP